MNTFSKIFNRSGDTIVEVLIAVAVISSVLIGAYLVAQKSTMGVRNSQEHSEMAQLLQGQVELVRSMAVLEKDTTAGIFATSPRYFCIDGTNPTTPIRENFPLNFVLPSTTSDSLSSPPYPGQCHNISGQYNVAIKYDGPQPGGTGVFTFYGRWERLGGGMNEEKLSYRAYPTP